MYEPLTKCCTSDLEGLWINFLANIVQGRAQASGSDHHFTFQNVMNSFLKTCLSYIRKKKQEADISTLVIHIRDISVEKELQNFLNKIIKKKIYNFLTQ